MLTALVLLALQGAIGAFDTLYYHEWKARLPARCPATAGELRLHALRDFLYALIFGTLPWFAWTGLWTIVLGLVLIAEIVLTMADFVTESYVRKSFGDVDPGERVTHAVMGILYGAMIANLLPVLDDWFKLPSGLTPTPFTVPAPLAWGLTAMALGVLLSGLRDLYAALGLPHGGWPWNVCPP